MSPQETMQIPRAQHQKIELEPKLVTCGEMNALLGHSAPNVLL